MAKSKAGTKAKRGGDTSAGQGLPEGAEHFAPPKQPAKASASPVRPPGVTEEQAAAMTKQARERLLPLIQIGRLTEAEVTQIIDRQHAVRSTAAVLESLKNEMTLTYATKAEVKPLLVTVENRVGTTPEAIRLFGNAQIGQPPDVAHWFLHVMNEAPNAVLSTLEDLLTTNDLTEFQTNSLSWVSNKVSFHLRRAVLLRELVAADWNLTVAAKNLRASSSGSVVRLIRDLDLSKEYAEARKRGRGRPGRAPDPTK